MYNEIYFIKDERRLDILWNITYSCNFNCHYCSSPIISKIEKQYNFLFQPIENIDIIVNFLYQLSKYKNIYLELTGGEPLTVYYIRMLIEKLNFIKNLTIWSNLSFDKNIIEDIIHIRPDINIKASYHFNLTNDIVFEENLYILNSRKYVDPKYNTLGIILEPKLIDLSLQKYYYFEKKYKNFGVYIKQARYDYNNYFLYPKIILLIDSIEKKIGRTVYFCNTTNVDEYSYNIVQSKNMNIFLDWMCECPKRSFFISPFAYVYRCEAFFYQEREYLFNILQEDITDDFLQKNILTNISICKADRCNHCGWKVYKYKI